MSNLAEISNRLAATAIAVDADDLANLAAMHTDLASLSQSAAELPAEDAQRVSTLATSAGQLVEQLVLREAADTQKALAQISRSIGELQQLINGAADSRRSQNVQCPPLSGPVSPLSGLGDSESCRRNTLPAT